MPKITTGILGALGLITLNNPPFNTIDGELVEELVSALDEFEGAKLRGLLIKVDEGNFSAGADVNLFAAPSASQDVGARLAYFLGLVQRIETLPFPTMAAVKGLCLAGGLELALAFDLIWAADTSSFGQVEASIGAIPFGGGAQRLAARAGLARATEIVFGARFHPAAQFEQWNIINRVLPEAELNDKACKFMARLADNGATQALAMNKRLLRVKLNQGLAAADALNAQLSPEIFQTADFKTGVRSFMTEGPGKAKFAGR